MNLFLLGAGFNVDAAREVGPIYGNSINIGRYRMDCGYPVVADVARFCFPPGQVPKGRSVEELFAHALERHDYAPLNKLFDRLMEADYRLALHLSSSDAPNCYRKFFNTFAESNFLTFNYDSLPEILLHAAERWHPHDGYGVKVAAEPVSARAMNGQTSKSLVLHLHGTFCVYTTEFEIKRNPGDPVARLEPLGRPVYNFDPDSISHRFPSYRRPISSTGHVRIEDRVIAPIPDKAEQLKQPFIRETFVTACSLVREFGTLTAIGYSFNPHDGASYEPILKALAESRQRRLVVVSPQARELVERIRSEQPRLLVEPIEKTMKTWADDSFRDNHGLGLHDR